MPPRRTRTAASKKANSVPSESASPSGSKKPAAPAKAVPGRVRGGVARRPVSNALPAAGGGTNVSEWASGDADTAETDGSVVERSPKRRRTAGEPGDKGKGKSAAVQAGAVATDSDDDPLVAHPEEVEVSEEEGSEFEADDSGDESDVDWEDVDLSAGPVTASILPPEKLNDGTKPPEKLELNLHDPETRKEAAGPRRLKITAVERRMRLETHKMHVLCLLHHVSLRNEWCNNETVKDHVEPLLPENSYKLLHHNPSDQQYRRSRFFLDGLKIAADTFRRKFKITHEGIAAPLWRDAKDLKNWSISPNVEQLMSKDSFIAAAKEMKGSRDTGTQLFCAMLRGCGITTRLVCSLQALPFTFEAKSTAQNHEEEEEDEEAGTPPAPAPKPTDGLSLLRRPHLRDIASMVAGKPKPKPKPKPGSKWASKPKPDLIFESEHPVYWAEAWSVAAQKWICVDPLVTSTVGKPGKIEPPKSDVLNSLTYAVAFEETGHATDVTRRYAHSFSGYTRRHRVTSTKNGYHWWRSALQHFSRRYAIDRDQLEEAELLQRELAEPIPNNIQDLKGHPLFALKRHLKRNEVIHPERKVSTLTIGVKGKGGEKGQKTEIVYRRQDVKEVKSEERWYRAGRTVKETELGRPLTFSKPSVMKKRGDRDQQLEERLNQPMYALYQTELYTPPPVTNGLIPKNKFGNLDVFVPTMVPPGGAHVRDKAAAKASRLLGIDHAEVVSGFEFRSRQATAVLDGVVVAKEYEDAVRAVLQGFRDEEEVEEMRRRSRKALQKWARFLMRLRIRERLGMEREPRSPETQEETEEAVEEEGRVVRRTERAGEILLAIEGESKGGGEAKKKYPGLGALRGGGLLAAADDAGGFIPEGYGGGDSESGGFLPGSGDAGDSDEGGGFLLDSGGVPEANDDGGFLRGQDADGFALGEHAGADEGGGRFMPDDQDTGGGFIPEDDDSNSGGGFIQEPETGGFVRDESVLKERVESDGGRTEEREEAEGCPKAEGARVAVGIADVADEDRGVPRSAFQPLQLPVNDGPTTDAKEDLLAPAKLSKVSASEKQEVVVQAAATPKENESDTSDEEMEDPDLYDDEMDDWC